MTILYLRRVALRGAAELVLAAQLSRFQQLLVAARKAGKLNLQPLLEKLTRMVWLGPRTSRISPND